MNLEHSSEESNTHSSSGDDVDQDNDNKIVQENNYFRPPSEILDIYSLSSDNDKSSGAITNNNVTEKDLHKKSFPRNLLPNAGPRGADAGTGVPSFEPSF